MEDLQCQLNQMRQALAVADASDKPGLQSIISQLEELIAFSDDSPLPISAEQPSGSTTAANAESSESASNDDDEFKKFQDEIAALEASENVTCANGDGSVHQCTSEATTDPDDDGFESSIMNEVSALEGTKCSAPHQPSWGQLGYYNAIILNAEPYEPPDGEGSAEQKQSMLSLDSIMVRVAFTQPVVESMLPCPFYQESRCRFGDDECKYSHGEVLPLSALRDYREPDFSQVVSGCRVLAKYKNGLWYKATVLNFLDEDPQICKIKYDNIKEADEIPLHELTPLDFSEDDSDGSSDSDEDFSSKAQEDVSEFPSNFQIISSKDAFGEWEKYTLGMGSKLMSKMGYIQGSGLGKNGEGRVEPVDAKLYPIGLSIDACMDIREGKGKKAVTVEQKLKRQSKKAEADFIRRQNSNGTVFDFLNSSLKMKSSKRGSSDFSISKCNKTLVQINKASSSTLSKNLFSVGENINQMKKKISKLKEGLQRQSSSESVIASSIKEKIKDAEKELNEMERREGTLLNERKNRHEKKKLAIF